MQEFSKGFTLIEIVITLSILSIAFAMSLSILSSISVGGANNQYLKADLDSVRSIITELWQLRFGGEKNILIHCDNSKNLSLWFGVLSQKIDEIQLKYTSCQNTATNIQLPDQNAMVGELIQPFILQFDVLTVSINKFGYASFSS
ncbi:MAG: prepilin-type N-terminal cleavage/methylation domain-containing protein [bacterium]